MSGKKVALRDELDRLASQRFSGADISAPRKQLSDHRAGDRPGVNVLRSGGASGLPRAFLGLSEATLRAQGLREHRRE